MLKRNDEEIFAHHVHKIQGCSVKNETFRSLGRGRLCGTYATKVRSKGILMKACVIVHVPVCNNSRIISNITKKEI